MKRGTPSHPKTLALAAALGLKRWGVVGILESLWHFAAQYAKRGDVGRHSDAAIVAAMDWKGDPAALIGILTDCGWLDVCACHRLRVHDWHDHADQAVHKSKEVHTYGFLECYPPRRPSGKPPEGGYKKDSGPPEGITPPPATATATVKATAPADVVGGSGGGEPEPSTATPAEARVVALRALAPPTVGSKTGPPNPLVDRDVLIPEGYRLIRQIAAVTGLDGSEVLRKASDWDGYGYVALDSMPDNRLAQTLVRLRSWARSLTGQPEPGPPIRAAPVNAKARERTEGFNAELAGGLKGDGSSVGAGLQRAVGDLPGPGPGGEREVGTGPGLPERAGRPRR